MLDFRASLLSILSVQSWGYLQFWVGILLAIGFIWQLVYDSKFAVNGTYENAIGRIGLVWRFTFAVAGIGDSFSGQEAHPLFVSFMLGTLISQGAFFSRWIRAGRPSFVS